MPTFPCKTAAILLMATIIAAIPVPSIAGEETETNARRPMNFKIVPTSSSASAKVGFFGLSSKTARFPAITGTIAIDRSRPETIAIDVSLDVTRLTASDAVTEARLKGPAFFDAARTPIVRFTGGRFHQIGPNDARIDGTLVAHGIAKPMTLDVRFSKPVNQIDGSSQLEIEGAAQIDRRDFGMKSYPLIVGRSVSIAMDIHLVPDAKGRP